MPLDEDREVTQAFDADGTVFAVFLFILLDIVEQNLRGEDVLTSDH